MTKPSNTSGAYDVIKRLRINLFILSSPTCRYDLDTHPTDTFKAMEKLVEKGLVRSIGVSNFNSAQMSDIMEKCGTKIATNQVECHAFLNQAKLLQFCKDKGIVLTAYRQAAESFLHEKLFGECFCNQVP